MDFGRIVNRSLAIAWKYKWLWIFGMFAGGGGSYFNFNLPTRDSRELDISGLENFDLPWSPSDYLDVTPELIGMFLLTVFVIILFFIVAGLISEAAIIDSVNRIERGGIASFGRAFSAGVDYLLRFFGLMILGFVTGIALFAVTVLILVATFSIHVAVGVVSLLFTVPGLIFAIFVIFTVFSLAQRVIVVRNCSIGDGLEEGYVLLKRNLGDSGWMFAIYVGLMIIIAIMGMILLAFFSLPFIGIGLMTDVNPIVALLAGIAIGLPLTFVVGGYLGVFTSNLYTLFYFQLVEPIKAAAVQPTPPPSPLT